MNSLLKLWIISILVVIFSSPVMAVTQIPLLEVTGTLEDVDLKSDPPVITLKALNGELASGELAEVCVFMDEKGRITEKTVFFRRYMKRVITLEVTEDAGVVITCRVGS